MKKRTFLTLCWLLLGFQISSCSKAIGENNAASTNYESGEKGSAKTISNHPAQEIGNTSSPTPKDGVLFDGKNYIKKSGWKVPSRNNSYVDDTYDQGDLKRKTATGKQVEMKTVNYLYKTPWFYSQDFYFEGRELDYMKGNLSAGHFFEMSANGKVFMYTIGGNEKVVPPPMSNSDPHEDPFAYQIQDKDGDGIFETLLGDYDEIIVPDWVLK